MNKREYLKLEEKKNTLLQMLNDKPDGKIHRSTLSTEEIFIFNRLVKDGYVIKTKSDNKNPTVVFSITNSGIQILNKNNVW